MKIKEITAAIEAAAPISYQEAYDNSGLLVGNPSDEVSSVLLTLDVTEEVVDEAIEKGCGLIVAHHPIIFSGLKKLNGKNYVERTVIKAIKNDVAIYAAHTNLDNVKNGVNFKIAERLGLQNSRILVPKSNQLMKLVVFVPLSDVERLLAVLHQAGAGNVGNYDQCSFSVEGSGRFRPNDAANPTIGEVNNVERVAEKRIEVIFPAFLKQSLLAAMRAAHPYEEVAYFVHSLENVNQDVGSGVVGEFPEPLTLNDFFTLVKDNMRAKVIRHTAPTQEKVQRVAVCGGSGSFLLKDAIAAGADVFLTADFKYHEFFDAENKIVIADIGHFESEQFTKELLRDIILKKIPNFATYLSSVDTNPVSYYF